MVSKLQIIYRNPSDLKGYEKNSRTHSEDQIERIQASINEFGFINPVVIHSDDVIVAGHARVEAAIALGIKEIPTINASHLTKTQMRAYVIADNRLAELSDWDEDILKGELSDLMGLDFDINLTGFDDDYFDLSADGILEEDRIDNTEIEPPENPVTRKGDVWIMGNHKVMCGDSLSPESIAELCGDKVDLWITDPPYNVAYQGGTSEALTIQNDDMEDSDFRKFLTGAYIAADGVMKDGAVFYIWHADSEGYNFRGACIDVGWQVRQCLIWQKNTFVLGRQDYHWQHEPCLYGWKSGAAHNWYSDRTQTTLLEFDKPQRNDVHPTMKPLDLFKYQIENSSKRGDIVLDSFGGSGTTLIACESLGRKARLMELDERYVDVIVKRWQEFTGLQATNERSGEFFDNLGSE